MAALAMVAALAACGPTGSVSVPATSGGETASGARVQAAMYGVMVDLLSDPKTYTISVVSWNGTVAASIKAARRSLPAGALELPYVSTTSTALYYLDGGYAVRRVRLDGMVEEPDAVAQFDVPEGSEVVFAVSPDDKQIAWSRLNLTSAPIHDYVYVDAIGGPLQHLIYDSTTNYVWPVAWHHGQLVLAHGYGVYVQDALKAAPAQDNPYWAISYHVVDPATAARSAKIGEACTVSGPLSPAGSACIQGGTEDWTGANTNWSTYDWGSISSAGSLSPDGSLVAAAQPDDEYKFAFWRQGGSIVYYIAGSGRGDWAGWLDNTHLIVGNATRTDFPTRVVTLTRVAPALQYPDVRGFYAARLPTDIS